MTHSKADLEFLAKHTKTLFDNRERIQADPVLSGAYSPEIRLMVAYTSGGGMLPLAVLLDLWNQGYWMHNCSGCQGRILIHQMGGSPLSGSNVWRGVCIGCGQVTEEGTWSGSGQRFIEHGVVPAVRARKKWNVSEDFGIEQAQRRDPSVQRIDIQGGMTIETDEGNADLQLDFGDWGNLGRPRRQNNELCATIPLQRILLRLQNS